jgi:peptide/nickel transport system permease protein
VSAGMGNGAVVAPGRLPAAGAGSAAQQVRRQRLHLLLRSKSFLIGSGILLVWVICAVFGDLLVPFDPTAQDLLATNAAPSGAHLLGTDSLGRDVLARVIAGSREILIVAPTAAFLGVAFGTVVGLLQGYYRGFIDITSGRVVEAFLSLPLVIVAFLFIVSLGTSVLTLILVIAFSFGLLSSRTVRAAVLQERELDYVAASHLRGERGIHIMFVEILPNIMGPVIVEFTVRLGYAVFAVATLSFLGFGVRPPTPDWGADIAANYQFLAAGFWWETLFYALAIASLIAAINLVGDAIEAVIDE